MKNWTKVLAALAIVGMVSVSAVRAEDPKPVTPKPAKADKPAKGTGIRGKVVKVDGTNLVVTTGKKGQETEKTVVTDDKTVVTIEGKEGKLADLKAGQVVRITPDTGTATKIEVPMPKAKKDAK
jgi:hypothetical protein